MDKSKSRAENQAARRLPFERYTADLKAAEQKNAEEASKPQARTPRIHDSIEVKNDGTKVCVEARLTPAHTKSLIKVRDNGDQYGKFHTHYNWASTNIFLVYQEVLNSLVTHKFAVKDVAVLIELQHPGQVTRPFAISQRQFFRNLVDCLNQFTQLESVKIYIQTQVKNLHSDSAWHQFSDAVNFYRLKFVDWELYIGYMGQFPTDKIEIGSRIERRLDGFRLRIEAQQEEKRAKRVEPVAPKTNATAPSPVTTNTAHPSAQPPVQPKPAVPVTPLVEMFSRLSTVKKSQTLTRDARVVGLNGTVLPKDKKDDGKGEAKPFGYLRGG
jgi:hypothetical protein